MLRGAVCAVLAREDTIIENKNHNNKYVRRRRQGTVSIWGGKEGGEQGGQ